MKKTKGKKGSSDDVDVILVGGGSIVLFEELAGAKTVTKAEFGGVANAIGSAISKVSGTYEQLSTIMRFRVRKQLNWLLQLVRSVKR